MLTRIEVDGFKNLLGFHVDLGPYTCVAGPNATGKSNLFDALRFLSLLADYPIMEAAQRVRSAAGQPSDPRDLFWTDGERRAQEMSFAVELIVPREVVDDFGRSTNATSTFLRYELVLGHEGASNVTGFEHLGRLVLRREQLSYITKGDAAGHLRFPHGVGTFRDAIVHNQRKGGDFISTVEEDGHLTIRVHQDGGSRGQPKPSPATSAPKTILGTTTTSSDPTILAARRELQSWRFLAFEPSAMRAPDAFVVAASAKSAQIAANGGHMAAALYRLAMDTARRTGSEPEDVYARVATRAAELIRVADLRIDRDDTRELLTLELSEVGRGFMPARALSDGTLRFLALCLIESDPDTLGLWCIEEPENGIHPARIEAMVRLVRELAVDPQDTPSPDNPLRQVLVNTHSPHFVQLQNPADLLLATEATVRGPADRPATALRLRPLADTWRCSPAEAGVGMSAVIAYLTAPPNAQLTLDEDALAAE
ncbi:MAG: AAA family ATPase [Sandaracinaceae bacterium]